MTSKFRVPKVITLHDKFPVVVGDTFTFDVFLYSDPQLERVLPLANNELTVTASDDRANPTVEIVKTIGDGITVISADIGQVRVAFTPSDTESLGVYGGTLYFEVKLEDEDSNVFTVARGSLALQPESA
jgi:hypothetical protein